MAVALHSNVKAKTVMKGKLNVYRFCDDVWTFVVDNPTFKFESETVSADRIKGKLNLFMGKVVACSAKS